MSWRTWGFFSALWQPGGAAPVCGGHPVACGQSAGEGGEGGVAPGRRVAPGAPTLGDNFLGTNFLRVGDSEEAFRGFTKKKRKKTKGIP